MHHFAPIRLRAKFESDKKRFDSMNPVGMLRGGGGCKHRPHTPCTYRLPTVKPFFLSLISLWIFRTMFNRQFMVKFTFLEILDYGFT